MSESTLVYCIKNDLFLFNFTQCKFIENHYYKLTHDEEKINPLSICDEKGLSFDFHPDSYFNKNIRNSYFMSLKECRKIKLKKLNEINI